MKLSKSLSIVPSTYATQGNAILGIKKSGKTYSATWLAEQLMQNDIPIIAFDPIGIWKNLKIGVKGNKGFPIVVAGEGGDLPLTPDTAPDIVRAAMKENVSLVVDLYSMHLSKADWKRIVEQCVRLLLYENKSLRHLFIEEAAEFCPQVVGQQDGKVYAEIEKLARMGGNASLGFTLINQRAEQVNKAVLELCDCLFLHRQKGRHSITALQKWLDAADVSNANEIAASLPSLAKGECWVWVEGSHKPVRVKMPEKRTFHPDRDNPSAITARTGTSVDVSLFVEKMKISLAEAGDKKYKEVKKIVEKSAKENPIQIMENAELEDLRKENHQLKEEVSKKKKEIRILHERMDSVKQILKPQFQAMSKLFNAIGEDETSENGVDHGKYQIWLDKLSGNTKKMMEQILIHRRLDRKRWCLLAGVSYTSSGFDTGARELKKLKLVAKEGNEFVLQLI